MSRLEQRLDSLCNQFQKLNTDSKENQSRAMPSFHSCQGRGHFKRDCNWASGSSDPSVQCQLCVQFGHTSINCRKYQRSGSERHSRGTRRENGLLHHLLFSYPNPNLLRSVICKEKYSYTPDAFKAGTRAKRQKTDCHSIAEEIISEHKMSTPAALQSGEGKRLISNYMYLAKYVSVSKHITIDIDSELVQKDFQSAGACCYPKYCLPIEAKFDKNGFVCQSVLELVHQRKGEAEMSQIDWLEDISKDF